MDKIYQVIDANLNRAAEGLRVLEDIFRFVFKDKFFSKEYKDIRHTIRDILKDLNIIYFREIESDEGRDSFSDSEKKRDSIEDIFKANLKRVEESLRVLEEFLKPVKQELSYTCKQLRFKVYSLEQSFFNVKYKFTSLLKGNKPLIYGIIDARFSSKNHITICKHLIKGGMKIIQLREKVLNDNAFLIIAKELSEICKENEVLFIVNDRVDIAYLSDASGVHLGQDDLTLNEAKKIIGFNKILGKSTHNLKQVELAIEEGPDYIGFGPIFPTKSKENPDPVVGIENLKLVKKKFPQIPVVAIGGINLSNIDMVLNCHPEMLCVLSGIISKENIENEITKYRRIINDSA